MPLPNPDLSLFDLPPAATRTSEHTPRILLRDRQEFLVDRYSESAEQLSARMNQRSI